MRERDITNRQGQTRPVLASQRCRRPGLQSEADLDWVAAELSDRPRND